MVENTMDLVNIQMKQKGLEQVMEFDPELLNIEVIGDKQRLS